MTTPVDQDTRRMGAGLRALRRERGDHQGIVAETMGTDTGSVSRIENGKRDPSLKQLRRLARRYRMPLAKLVEEAESRGGVVVHGPSIPRRAARS